MNINLNIKPFKYEARTKAALISKISSKHLNSFSSCETYLSPFGRYVNDRTHKRVYNLVKIRPKFKQTKRNVKGNIVTKSVKIREGKWIAYVYDMPKFVQVKQKARNFEIVGIDYRSMK